MFNLRAIIISALLVAGFTPCARGQELSSKQLPPQGKPWLGIATRYDPRMIGGQYLKDAANVWFNEDLGAIKRNGFNQFGAIGNSLPIRSMARWIDTTGAETLFVVSGTTVGYYSTGGTFTQTTHTKTDSEMSIATAMNDIWFANATDGLFYWDGASMESSTNAATGRYVSRWRNRLWLAGISGARARLDGSHHLDGNTWTVGNTADSPTQIVIGANDGYPINCLFGGHSDYLLVGKERGIWLMTGFDKDDFKPVEVDPEVGCRSNRTVASANTDTFWLSHRGVERMRGFKIDKISEPIQDIVDNIVQSAAQSRYWTQTTKIHWDAGNLEASGPGAPMDSDLTLGAIVPSTWTDVDTSSTNFAAGTLDSVDIVASAGDLRSSSNTLKDDFSDGDLTNNPTWTPISGNWAVSGAELWNYSASGQAGLTSIDISALPISSGSWKFRHRHNGLPSYGNSCAGCTGSAVTCFGYRFVVDGSNYYEARVSEDTSAGCTSNVKTVSLIRNSGGESTLASDAAVTYANGTNYNWEIKRSTTGAMSVLINDAVILSTTNIDIRGADKQTVTAYTDYYVADGRSNYHYFDNFDISQYRSSGTFVSRIFDTTFSTPTLGAFVVDMTTSADYGITFQTQSSTASDGGGFEALVAQTPGDLISATAGRRYLRYKGFYSVSTATKTPELHSVTLSAATTGYAISQCKNIGTEITAWDVFNAATESNGNTSFSFAMSTGTGCNEVTRTTATWTSITDGVTPTLSTASYIAIRTLFSLTSASETIKLHDFEVTWIEGSNSQLPIGCADLDGNYWLFYTTSTDADARLDSSIVYQTNGNWTRMNGIPALSCAQFNNRWYTGSSEDDGKVHEQNAGYSDDGNAISAFIETPDYDFDCWYCWKDFKRLHLDLKNPATDADFESSFMVNGDNTWYSLGTITLDEDTTYIHGELPWPSSEIQKGKLIRFKFGNSQAGEDFRFHRGLVVYEQSPPNL